MWVIWFFGFRVAPKGPEFLNRKRVIHKFPVLLPMKLF